MRRVFAAFIFIVTSIVSYAQIADPLFMPKKGNFVSETEFSLNKLYRGLGSNFPMFASDPKIYTVKQTIGYAVADNLYISLGIGYGKVDIDANPALTSDDLSKSGFTDPELTLRYRISDDIGQNMLLDVVAYARVSVFDSYLKNEKSFDITGGAPTVDINSGPALGADEYYLYFLTGKKVDNISFALRAGGGYISAIELVDNFENQWYFWAGFSGRYYLTEKHALGFDFDYNYHSSIIDVGGNSQPDTERNYTNIVYGVSYDFSLTQTVAFSAFYREQIFDIAVDKKPYNLGLKMKALF
ncbi:hypothetical protein Emin_0993 [Elusimicrobium minutum Pei191]|uniref:Uncharacterized protein n=1 Tax=Elusimicrobium minutum (strain Pei191) TaxID=445932 RepID=B2KDF0_ELUMP|nr:hypothetical protein [Elusimicrobium minutum]ACC98546.1 hypothetical protein Emin_0993 [Elusimicrobium minutum Pei191]